jgi:hypothetical protein
MFPASPGFAAESVPCLAKCPNYNGVTGLCTISFWWKVY